MGAYYDIYGFSRRQDKAWIEKFLDRYAERQVIEKRADQDIGVYHDERYGIEEQIIPIQNLTQVIDYGIQHEYACFAFYIGDGLKGDIKHLILKFTSDATFIFGVCIEQQETNGGDNYKRAAAIEQELKTFLNIEKTSIQVEYPPADEAEFLESVALWRTMNEEKSADL